ncbi:unnamed protein product [Fusarium equiseti]|uniref:Uncharacterized protein n=1 Tax=Fusarium equiseti TaxID=61235 RepID=A0A8J2NB78_FUSEQ|nr:unnamed protein product [Fusarium equiseti]
MSAGPTRFFVSSLHGCAAISDGECPVNISPSSQGAIISSKKSGSGKVHFTLPTLPSPPEESLTGHATMSVVLEISLSPHPQPDPNALCKVARVELHAGRDQLGQWDAGEKDNDWSIDDDIRIPVWSDIAGAGDNVFNDNPRGFCVTLTLEFGGGLSLLISSVALIQSVESLPKPKKRFGETCVVI